MAKMSALLLKPLRLVNSPPLKVLLLASPLPWLVPFWLLYLRSSSPSHNLPAHSDDPDRPVLNLSFILRSNNSIISLHTCRLRLSIPSGQSMIVRSIIRSRMGSFISGCKRLFRRRLTAGKRLGVRGGKTPIRLYKDYERLLC